jgi:UDP-N-acetylglucosamine 2-epimerase (non-hydrolysing)
VTAPYLHLVGARPNFMKVAPVHRALAAIEQPQMIVHTGQHYDPNMSDVFFDELGLPRPDVNLEVGSGSHAAQTARIMTGVEGVVLDRRPKALIVYGDVNSTVAGALVCAKLGVPVVHVEAGLRSFDRTMPEEINRIVTDRLADVLYTPSEDGDRHLLAEGVPADRIVCVGNVMIDTLARLRPAAAARWEALAPTLPPRYGLVTLHRPSNVDEPAVLQSLMEALEQIGQTLPLLFPMHPRTRVRLADLGWREEESAVQILAPQGYLAFLALEEHAVLVLTDSGGVQEETTYLKVPCLTIRENTERPVTVTMGSNLLVGHDRVRLVAEALRIAGGDTRPSRVPPLWDGSAGDRIARDLVQRGF